MLKESDNSSQVKGVADTKSAGKIIAGILRRVCRGRPRYNPEVMINPRDSNEDLREDLGEALVIWCSSVIDLAVMHAVVLLYIFVFYTLYPAVAAPTTASIIFHCFLRLSLSWKENSTSHKFPRLQATMVMKGVGPTASLYWHH